MTSFANGKVSCVPPPQKLQYSIVNYMNGSCFLLTLKINEKVKYT